MYYFFGGVVWFALCILTATLADKKGHNGIGFFFLALFLSPLVGLLVIACVGDKNQVALKEEDSEKEKWVAARIVELISSGKNATDAKIQAEAEYSINKNKSPSFTR